MAEEGKVPQFKIKNNTIIPTAFIFVNCSVTRELYKYFTFHEWHSFYTTEIRGSKCYKSWWDHFHSGVWSVLLDSVGGKYCLLGTFELLLLVYSGK